MSMSPQASKIFLRCQKYRAAGMAAPVWVPLSVEISTDPHMDQSSQQQYRVVRRTPPQHVAMNSEPSSWGWQAFIHHRLLGALSTHGSSLLCVVCGLSLCFVASRRVKDIGVHVPGPRAYLSRVPKCVCGCVNWFVLLSWNKSS
jgi:hypothetical protein